MASRREFILSACKLCLAVGAAGSVAAFLEGCKTIQVVTAENEGEDQLKIPMTSFAENSQVLVRSRKVSQDILAVRKPGDTYTALLLECTHENQPLTASGNSIFCSSHGSKFDLDGNVVTSPASRPLRKYPANVSGEYLFIKIK